MTCDTSDSRECRVARAAGSGPCRGRKTRLSRMLHDGRFRTAGLPAPYAYRLFCGRHNTPLRSSPCTDGLCGSCRISVPHVSLEANTSSAGRGQSGCPSTSARCGNPRTCSRMILYVYRLSCDRPCSRSVSCPYRVVLCGSLCRSWFYVSRSAGISYPGRDRIE